MEEVRSVCRLVRSAFLINCRLRLKTFPSRFITKNRILKYQKRIFIRITVCVPVFLFSAFFLPFLFLNMYLYSMKLSSCLVLIFKVNNSL